jgi:hypothetical protein
MSSQLTQELIYVNPPNRDNVTILFRFTNKNVFLFQKPEPENYNGKDLAVICV